MKYIITILLAGIIGIIFNPEFLAASDSVKIHECDRLTQMLTFLQKPSLVREGVAPQA